MDYALLRRKGQSWTDDWKDLGNREKRNRVFIGGGGGELWDRENTGINNPLERTKVKGKLNKLI